MPLPTQASLLVLAFIAAAYDIRHGRIPNALIVGAAAWSLALAGWSGHWHGLLVAFEGMGTGFAVMLPLFALGWVAGGDVKLLAALGALAGYPDVLTLLLGMALAGGLLALVWLGWARVTKWRPVAEGDSTLGEVRDPTPPPAPSRPALRLRLAALPPMPYAVAMAAGTVALFLVPAGWWFR